MKVIIVGAGLGGLACAVACRRANLDVTVLEKSPDASEIGAGIQIPPNGATILNELDLLPQIVEKGSIVQHVDFRRYNSGQLIRSMPFGEGVEREFGVPWVIIHRQDFYEALLLGATRLGAEIQLGAEVTDIIFESPEVVLAGGERVRGDVIIGADGLYSRVRDLILSSPTPPTETGDLAYRATFTRSQLESLNDPDVTELCQKTAVTSWLGPDKHTIFYPVRGGKEFNLVLLRPDDLGKGAKRVEGDIDEMKESYAGWDETLRKVISCVSAVSKWKLTTLPELETWTRGPVALLGDACHPTLPYQAQGAAMAVEDGFALGKLLGLLQSNISSEPEKHIPDILKIYENIRRARTTRNVQGAMRNRRIFHIPDGLVQSTRDFVLGYAGMTRESDWTYVFSMRMRATLKHDLEGNCRRGFEGWMSTLANSSD